MESTAALSELGIMQQVNEWPLGFSSSGKGDRIMDAHGYLGGQSGRLKVDYMSFVFLFFLAS